jgi:hypothetical protein
MTVQYESCTIPKRAMRKMCEVCGKRKSFFTRSLVVNQIFDGQVPVDPKSILGKRAVRLLRKLYGPVAKICSSDDCSDLMWADIEKRFEEVGAIRSGAE